MKSRLPLLLGAACLGMALASTSASAQEPRPVGAPAEASVGADKFERGTPVPSWVEQYSGVPATVDKSPVVVLLADTQLLVDETPAYHVHRMWLANSASGVEDVARFAIEFNPAYQRLQLHSLRILRGGESLDRLTSARTSFLQRETGLDSGVYTGNVTASLLIADLRVGDILEARYTLSGHNPVMGKRYVDSASWDQYWRAELRRVTLWHPDTRRIGWRMLGGDSKGAVAPQESVNAGIRKLRWEATGLARTFVDKDIPADYNPYRHLQFSEFATWGEVATWAHELFRADDSRSPELDQLVAQFMAKPTAQERVASALTWVQKEVRYFSLALGESSHRPAPAMVTLQRRYGDCKDKSALLIQLLRGMGIQAQPVLVSARELRGAARGLPSPYAFDHAIVRAEVSGKAYFLDPTRLGQGGLLAEMGQRWEGAEVLVVQPRNDKFTTITGDNAAITRSDLEERIKLAQFGSDGEISVRWTRTGVNAENARIQFAQVPNERVIRFLLEPYEKRYPGATPIGDITLADDPQQNAVIASMKLRLPGLARKAETTLGTVWAVSYSASNFEGLLPTPTTSVRSQPFAIPYNAATKYAVQIDFPEEAVVYSTPVSQKLHDDAFDVNVVRSTRGSQATAIMELKVLDYQVSPKRLPAYMAAVRNFKDSDRGQMLATASIVRPVFVPGQIKTDIQVTLERNHLSAVERLSKTIESGRLKGSDLVQARCERSGSLAILGKDKEALHDTEQALLDAPHLPLAHACRGYALLRNDDLAGATAEYTRAIVLDPDMVVAFFYRGQTRFYAGQFAAAAQDFAAARKLARGKRESGFHHAIWQATALQRAGRPQDADLLALAGEDPRGDWPRPVMAMLHGLVSVDEMIGLAQLKQGEERERNLTEAYFYAGQQHLARGDKAKAAEYFRKTLGQGVVSFVEHRSALMELAAIEPPPKGEK